VRKKVPRGTVDPSDRVSANTGAASAEQSIVDDTAGIVTVTVKKGRGSAKLTTDPTKLGFYSKVQRRLIDLAKRKMRLSVVVRDGFPENEVIKDEARELIFEVVQDAKDALVIAPGCADGKIEPVNPQSEALDQLVMDPLLDNVVKIVSLPVFFTLLLLVLTVPFSRSLLGWS
jgi:hypothetical protein